MDSKGTDVIREGGEGSEGRETTDRRDRTIGPRKRVPMACLNVAGFFRAAFNSVSMDVLSYRGGDEILAK